MKIFETHSHYDDTAFDGDRDELISEMLRQIERANQIINNSKQENNE